MTPQEQRAFLALVEANPELREALAGVLRIVADATRFVQGFIDEHPEFLPIYFEALAATADEAADDAP